MSYNSAQIPMWRHIWSGNTSGSSSERRPSLVRVSIQFITVKLNILGTISTTRNCWWDFLFYFIFTHFLAYFFLPSFLSSFLPSFFLSFTLSIHSSPPPPPGSKGYSTKFIRKWHSMRLQISFYESCLTEKAILLIKLSKRCDPLHILTANKPRTLSSPSDQL